MTLFTTSHQARGDVTYSQFVYKIVSNEDFSPFFFLQVIQLQSRIENFEALDYFNFIFYFSNRFRPRSYFRLVPGNVYLFGSNLVLITFGRMIKSSLIPILGTNKSTQFKVLMRSFLEALARIFGSIYYYKEKDSVPKIRTRLVGCYEVTH